MRESGDDEQSKIFSPDTGFAGEVIMEPIDSPQLNVLIGIEKAVFREKALNEKKMEQICEGCAVYAVRIRGRGSVIDAGYIICKAEGEGVVIKRIVSLPEDNRDRREIRWRLIREVKIEGGRTGAKYVEVYPPGEDIRGPFEGLATSFKASGFVDNAELGDGVYYVFADHPEDARAGYPIPFIGYQGGLRFENSNRDQLHAEELEAFGGENCLSAEAVEGLLRSNSVRIFVMGAKIKPDNAADSRLRRIFGWVVCSLRGKKAVIGRIGIVPLSRGTGMSGGLIAMAFNQAEQKGEALYVEAPQSRRDLLAVETLFRGAGYNLTAEEDGLLRVSHIAQLPYVQAAEREPLRQQSAMLPAGPQPLFFKRATERDIRTIFGSTEDQPIHGLFQIKRGTITRFLGRLGRGELCLTVAMSGEDEASAEWAGYCLFIRNGGTRTVTVLTMGVRSMASIGDVDLQLLNHLAETFRESGYTVETYVKIGDGEAVAYYEGLGFERRETVEDSDIPGIRLEMLGIRGALRHMVCPEAAASHRGNEAASDIVISPLEGNEIPRPGLHGPTSIAVRRGEAMCACVYTRLQRLDTDTGGRKKEYELIIDELASINDPQHGIFIWKLIRSAIVRAAGSGIGRILILLSEAQGHDAELIFHELGFMEVEQYGRLCLVRQVYGSPDRLDLLKSPEGHCYAMVRGERVSISMCGANLKLYPRIQEWIRKHALVRRGGEMLSDIMQGYFNRVKSHECLAYLAGTGEALWGLTLFHHHPHDSVYIIDALDTFEPDPDNELVRALVDRMIRSCEEDDSMRGIGVRWDSQHEAVREALTEAGFTEGGYPKNFVPESGYRYYFKSSKPYSDSYAAKAARRVLESI